MEMGGFETEPQRRQSEDEGEEYTNSLLLSLEDNLTVHSS